jgi:hypothetical protein
MYTHMKRTRQQEGYPTSTVRPHPKKRDLHYTILLDKITIYTILIFAAKLLTLALLLLPSSSWWEESRARGEVPLVSLSTIPS